jgi:hypothetical protein
MNTNNTSYIIGIADVSGMAIIYFGGFFQRHLKKKYYTNFEFACLTVLDGVSSSITT